MRPFLLACALLPLSLLAQNPGELDLSFDADGKLVIADIDSMSDPFAVPTSDLGLIVGFNRTVDGQQQICMLRLNEDGSVNTNYGVQGLVVSTAPLVLKDVLIRPDDKVVLVGQVPGQEVLRVERYLPDGGLDASFGTGGVWELVIPDTIPNSFVSGGLMLPDERILVNGSFGVMRVLADGGVDVGFGVEGVFGQGGREDLALAPDGGLRWTRLVNGAPYTVDYDGGVVEPNIAVGSSCGINTSLRGALCINYFGRFVSSAIECLHISQYSSYRYKTAIISSMQLQSGTYMPFIIYDDLYLDQYQPEVSTINSSSKLLYTSDFGGNFYSSFSMKFVRYSNYSNWPSSFIVDTTFFSPSWQLRRYDNFGNRIFWSDQNEIIMTKFIANESTRNIAEYPTPTVLFPTANGKLIAVGYCEIDSVKRIVAARYHATPDPRTKSNIRVFLGGNYDANTGLMHDSLRAAGMVPQLAPYDAPHYLMANGRGGFATPASVLAMHGDSAVVDWVWLELMRDTLPGTVVATRVALVHRDGRVTANDGRSPVDFGIGAGNYLLRVRHRNHLSVTTATPVALGLEPVTIDFTDPATATYGTDAQMEVNGVRMLWPGQTNNDGLVRYAGSMNDRDRVLQAIGGTTPTAVTTGYRLEDVNLDGAVKYTGPNNDRDVILQTIGGTVPTAVRVEQAP